MKQRNGKIEFMRFIFCITVILFHIGKKYFGLDYQVNRFLSCFRHGDLGVEFFFLVSGYLFAAACVKKRGQEEPLGKSTLLYIYHKWISFYPQYLIAFCAVSALPEELRPVYARNCPGGRDLHPGLWKRTGRERLKKITNSVDPSHGR